jgi:hypothetical protein
MARTGAFGRWAFWTIASMTPIVIWLLRREFRDSIGCPPSGDCYVPGSESLLDWDLWLVCSALIIWPLAFWFTVLNRVRKWRPLSARNE